MSPPGPAYVIPARAGVWLVWYTSWGRLGGSGLSSCPLAYGSPRVGVFAGVRFGGRGIPGNVLLSKIYVLACSEPPLAKEFFKKDAQSFPETRISNLVRGRDFCS